MKFLLVLCLSVTIVLALEETYVQQQWSSFKVENNRDYETEAEEQFRYQTFKTNLELIEAHNEKHAQGLVSFTMGVNHFADRTDEEYRATLNYGYNRKHPKKVTI